jgi:hypothetical protein
MEGASLKLLLQYLILVKVSVIPEIWPDVAWFSFKLLFQIAKLFKYLKTKWAFTAQDQLHYQLANIQNICSSSTYIQNTGCNYGVT